MAVRSGETQLPAFITPHAEGVLLAIKLQPRASKNEIGEPLGPELRVKVTAPPVDAAANEALLRLLADTLDCPRRGGTGSRSYLATQAGAGSRHDSGRGLEQI